MFLYVTVSTLKPMVGMVDTTSPIWSLYKMVVLPALSRPSMSILTSSFLFQNASLENIEENVRPILKVVADGTKRRLICPSTQEATAQADAKYDGRAFEVKSAADSAANG